MAWKKWKKYIREPAVLQANEKAEEQISERELALSLASFCP